MLLWTVYCVRRALCSFHLFRNNVSSRSPLPSYRIMPKTLQHKSISVAKPGGWKKTVAGRKLWMHPRPQPRTAPVSCVSYSSVEVWCIMNSPSASPLAPVAGALNWYCPRCNVDHPRHLRTPSAMSAIQGSSVRGFFLVNVQNMIASFFQRLLAVFLWYLLCIIIPSHCLPCSPRHL